MEQKHCHPLNNYRETSTYLISGVCVAYITNYLEGRETTFQMKRSADVLTNHHSHTSFVPHVSSSLARADPSMDHGQALTPSVALYRGTGTADQADLARLGSAQLNLMSLHSTLVWQLPIIKHKISRHGGQYSMLLRSLVETATSTGQAT